MTISLEHAVVFDIETFPNCFTLAAEMFQHDAKSMYEISEFRDDREDLLRWFHHLEQNRIPMIGFNNLAFDYIVIHLLKRNPNATYKQLYDKAMELIHSQDKFGQMIWESDRFAPQIDLFKINHFDNRAKTTSLKALQFNMRSQSIVDMPVELNKFLTRDEIEYKLKPYNAHDTGETKKFAHNCIEAINFRIGLLETIQGDVMNFSDVKIGAKMLEQRIGENICYEPAYYDNDPFTGERHYNRKSMRQTIRSRIALNDIIFPYIKFNHPEFVRVLNWMKQQVLTPDDLDDPDAAVKTKGVFKNIIANVGGLHFQFGTGGMHASVTPQRVLSDENTTIEDIDVEGMYPAIARVNRLAPAHLGEAYITEYSKIPIERKQWQKSHGKKCVQANALKLAANGPWGQSNNPFTIFFDSQYAMTVPINGQLLLCMLADWLVNVPTIQFIQANTDGLTYRIHKDYRDQARFICGEWEKFTLLTLEYAQYKRMWIRDVNNYIAEDMDGKLKQKGAYWHPDPLDYVKSISQSQPPAWHKDLGNCISIRAAVAAMVQGINPEYFIKAHTDKFDFMLRAKVGGDSKLMLGDRQLQKTSRYYVSTDGETLRKVLPPLGPKGTFKRKTGVTEAEYLRVMQSNGWQWDKSVCTGNKSTYEERVTMFEAGFKVTECNDADDFRFNNINYDYYINEARKLII